MLPPKHHLDEIIKGKKKAEQKKGDLIYLLSRGSSEDEGGKYREGVFGVCWPAFNRGPHGKAEERNRLW